MNAAINVAFLVSGLMKRRRTARPFDQFRSADSGLVAIVFFFVVVVVEDQVNRSGKRQFLARLNDASFSFSPVTDGRFRPYVGHQSRINLAR